MILSRFLISLVPYFLLALTSINVHAYQWETTLSHLQIEADDNSREAKTTDINATWYINPVNTNKGPLAESGYTAQVSSLNFGYADTTFDFSGSGKLDGPAIILGARYVVPESEYIIAIDYINVALDDGPSKLDLDSFTLTAGKYFTDTLTGFLSYTDNTIDGSTGFTDLDTTIIALGLKNIIQMGEKYINVEGSIESETQEYSSATADETNTTISLLGDYYFNREFSLGADLELNNGDDVATEGTSFGVNSRYFFNPQFSILASYTTFSADNAGEIDDDTLELSLSARF